MNRLACCFLGIFLGGAGGVSHGGAADAGREGKGDWGASPEGVAPATRGTVIPLFGWDRSKMVLHGERGQPVTRRDTAPVCGLFAMIAHRNFVLTDYFFSSDVHNANVWGNLAFLNWYGDRQARFSWNAGVGHLYHKIEPANQEITVTAPMVKTGPILNFSEWNLRIHPYIGYAWERVETRRANLRNDSPLYGIRVGWRWRMIGTTLQYYYQDSQEAAEDYHTLRFRAHAMFNRNWGAAVRLDYMEKHKMENSSIQLGPVYMFGGVPRVSPRE